MKKIITTLLSVCALGSMGYAQTSSEILQLTQNQVIGTARFNGVSGAFGALGGDLSALAENPAASAVFTNSYGSITVGQSGNRSRSTYFGEATTEDEANLDFNQIGGVLILKNTANVGASKIAFGIAYNKTADFRNDVAISGEANNSIGDFFTGFANGTDVANFELLEGETLTQAYVNIGRDPNLGFAGQQGFLGFQGLLINDDSPTTFSSAITGNTRQNIAIETRGSSGKISFNAAGEFSEHFYVGANINVHRLDFERVILLDEFNQSTTSNLDGSTFINQTRTTGTGVSFDVGGIAKFDNGFRIGLSYQSPVFYELEDSFSQSLTTFFRDGSDPQFVAPNAVIVLPTFELRTPGTFSGSLAYVFGKKGLISGQYSRKDLSNIEYTSNGLAFEELNSIVENTFDVVNTFRIGGEYRNGNWTWRGGVSRITSPYRDNRIEGDTDGFSLGAGYNWGKWKLDVAYNHTEVDRTEALFETNSFQNNATVNRNIDAVSVTVGVNF